MVEIKKHEAIAAIWAKCALIVGSIFLVICMTVGIILFSLK